MVWLLRRGVWVGWLSVEMWGKAGLFIDDGKEDLVDEDLCCRMRRVHGSYICVSSVGP